MNRIIAAFVGALAATTLMLGGVHVAKGDQSPVANTHLKTYANS